MTVTRRDFLNSALLGCGGSLLGAAAPIDLLAARGNPFDGYGGVGDYALANGNTYDVVTAGHALRDGAYARAAARDAEPAGTFDCVVVGGGISGLAAALFFQRMAPQRSCLVLEDHAIFGGLARATSSTSPASAWWRTRPRRCSSRRCRGPSSRSSIHRSAFRSSRSPTSAGPAPTPRCRSAGRRTSPAAAPRPSSSADASAGRTACCWWTHGGRGSSGRRSRTRRAGTC